MPRQSEGALVISLTGPRWPLCCSGSTSSLVMSSVLSLPPQFYNGNFDKGDVVVGPLVESRDIPLVEGLGIVVCGSEDDLEVLCGL